MRLKSCFRWLVAILLLSPFPASALNPYLVKDINSIPQDLSSSPTRFVSLGKLALFVATDALLGTELWASDGNPGGAYLVADSCPGECSGDPYLFGLAGDALFFLAWEGYPNRTALWVTRGTPATTFRLADGTNQVVSGRNVSLWLPLQRLLYFSLDDGEHGIELWRSDGTAAGTFMVTDLRPGPKGSDPREFAFFKGRVFFVADDGRNGPALWTSDSTPAGTRLVKDTYPSSAQHSGPRFLTALGSSLVYVAPSRTRGVELWASNGTSSGTVSLPEMVPGKGSTIVIDARPLGARLLLMTDDPRGTRFWATDGTARGTRLLKTFAVRNVYSPHFYFFPLPALGNQLVFPVDDGKNGTEPWISDGTPAGTRLLRDLCPGPCGSRAFPILAHRGQLWLSAATALGEEPWVSDGTPGGTRMVKDICQGACGSANDGYIALGKKVLFRADDGQTGRQLWSSDGSEAGTVRLTSWDAPSQGPREWVKIPGALLLNADDGLHGQELWRSDGTPAGTYLLENILANDHGGSYPYGMRGAGDRLFFFASDGSRKGLWTSDGTDSGTRFVRELTEGTQPIDPYQRQIAGSAALGERFFFLLTESNAPSSLWVSDGTSEGTRQLFREDGSRVEAREVGVAAGTVFFVGHDEEHGWELWRTDGTPGGTALVKDIEAGPQSSWPEALIEHTGRLFFSVSTFSGEQLWTSDGSSNGTALLKTIGAVTGTPYLAPRAVLDGKLYFFAENEDHGVDVELWVTDGSHAGTKLAVDFSPGSDRFYLGSIWAGDGRLFIHGGTVDVGGLWVSDGTPSGTRFVTPRISPYWSFPETRPVVFRGEFFFANGHGWDSELWRSDGTESGTRPVLDRDGEPILEPQSLLVFDGHLLFTAATGHFEQSLWQSDGSEGGTLPVRYLHGPTVSKTTGSMALVPAGSRVFFRAHDPSTGVELWGLRPD